MKQFISVSAPGKLMILGEHAVVYGFPCIVSAIDRYLTVEIKKIEGKRDMIITPQVCDDSFIRVAIEVFRKKYNLSDKIQLTTYSDITGFGLGSSAASVVATLNSLTKLFKINLNKKELFDLSYEALKKREPKASGFDIAASIYGGTIYFNGRTKSVSKISDDPLALVVGFSGIKADTPQMVEKVSQTRAKNPNKVNKIFTAISQIVEKGRLALEKKDWRLFGKLMTENHNLLVGLGVSTKKLDKMVLAAIAAGAYGAKLSGAGGGDCIIALVQGDKRKEVEKAIGKSGGMIL